MSSCDLNPRELSWQGVQTCWTICAIVGFSFALIMLVVSLAQGAPINTSSFKGVVILLSMGTSTLIAIYSLTKIASLQKLIEKEWCLSPLEESSQSILKLKSQQFWLAAAAISFLSAVFMLFVIMTKTEPGTFLRHASLIFFISPVLWTTCCLIKIKDNS